MPSFLTRIELHGATAIDYANLHEKMEAARFSRFIRASDGTNYRLPTAEYYSQGELKAEDVRDIARGVVAQTGKSAWIITVDYKQAAWVLSPA